MKLCVQALVQNKVLVPTSVLHRYHADIAHYVREHAHLESERASTFARDVPLRHAPRPKRIIALRAVLREGLDVL